MEDGRGKTRGKVYKKGRWQVERERCRIDDYAPSAGVADPVVLADVMAGVMKRLGLEDTHWISVLDEEWQAIVGEAVAKHTRPGRMEKKKLTVFVDSSVWLNELIRYGRQQILSNLQKKFGKDKILAVGLMLDPDDRIKSR